MIIAMAMRTLGALSLVCALSNAVHAQGSQPTADRLFAEGRALLANNQPAEACEKFEAAIKLDATATGTMLNLGLCYENLRKYATSIRWFRKAQAAAAENQLHEYEKAAKEHTIAITGLVNTVRIDVNGPPDAEVRVDGAKVAPTDYGRYEIDPGTYEIVGLTPGKKKVVQTLDVPERTPSEPNPPIELSIAFTENAVPVYADRGAGRRRSAMILGGAGGITLIGVGVYGLIEKYAFFNPGIDEGTPAGIQQAEDSQFRLRYWGTSVFVVGLGAVAAATFLYFTAPGLEQISDGTAFSPVISHDQLGFAVSGRF